MNDPGATADLNPTAPAAANGRIAAALRAHALDAARCLMDSVAGWEKYAGQIAAVQDLAQFLYRDYGFLVDYLALYFATGDATYRDLYIGDKVRQAFYEPESSVDAQLARRRQIVQADAQGLHALLDGSLDAADLAALDDAMQGIGRILTARAERSLDVLLVGDCLYLDVMAFLVGPCLEDGISINPTLVTTHNPAELRNALRAMRGRRFDAVFFSPFTYEFSPEYCRLMWWHQGASAPARIRALALAAMQNAGTTIDLLGELFECNIFVHNSVNIRRHDSSLADIARNLLSWRARRAGRSIVNAALARHVEQLNAATFPHLFVFDEMALLRQAGETQLGKLFYDHDSRHPAALGRYVADRYRDLLAAQAQLLTKKLIVCDLDETLWKGVIGEGAVEHYIDRQRLLKRLQAKGVVLAINSKNDPKNLHWDGALLGPQDFVSTQVNWNSKVVNLQRIAAHLNLKSKDFVFIDDRPDEREMVRMAMPEVCVLDATDPRTWRRLECWVQALASEQDADRTELYRQKDAREGFLQQQSAAVEDQGQLFEQLGLAVTVREAKKSDMKRVAELINRTNQFNTCGSRTSVQEVGSWLASSQHRILVVDCRDKFGTMGTISIAVVHSLPDRVEIPVFVLSCRVFGYGIERVVVNVVKRMALEAGLPVVGRYVETSHNEPCRKVYPDAGFGWDDGAWHWKGEGEIQDPPWLAISTA